MHLKGSEGGQGMGKCCDIILIKNIIPPHKNKAKLHQTVATLEHGIWVAYSVFLGHGHSTWLQNQLSIPFLGEN